MKKIGFVKWIVAGVLVLVLGFFGFTAEVREGENAVITRFGAARAEVTEAGLYFKLPWPFENVVKYDARNQYTESAYLETLTKDKRNVIFQSFAVWNIEDPLKYHTSVGNSELAAKYVNDLIINATNSVMGNYKMSNLVSLNEEELMIDEIENGIFERVKEHALSQYGIKVMDVSIMKLSLPENNLKSVFDQMTKDRQAAIDVISSNGQLEASKIMYEAEAEAARIMAEGVEKAAEINAETEKLVASIYAEAQAANISLYKFLTQLDTLMNSVNENTTLIVKKDEYPFDIFGSLPDDLLKKVAVAVAENEALDASKNAG
ncbi:MAG: protease modulator HflC [Clostridia bacterium]|nr:protease modulator HflC [Clostridia bacterium]MBQ1259735.1 protease modulator HflC [Clostridia bacterium]